MMSCASSCSSLQPFSSDGAVVVADAGREVVVVVAGALEVELVEVADGLVEGKPVFGLEHAAVPSRRHAPNHAAQIRRQRCVGAAPETTCPPRHALVTAATLG
jgi:hypothetical protein